VASARQAFVLLVSLWTGGDIQQRHLISQQVHVQIIMQIVPHVHVHISIFQQYIEARNSQGSWWIILLRHNTSQSIEFRAKISLHCKCAYKWSNSTMYVSSIAKGPLIFNKWLDFGLCWSGSYSRGSDLMMWAIHTWYVPVLRRYIIIYMYMYV